MKLNLKSKFLIFIFLPLLILFTALYLLLFPKVNTYTQDTYEVISSKNADYYSELFNNKFNSDIEILKSLKESFENYKGDLTYEKEFEKDILNNQIRNKKDIQSAWFLKEDTKDKYFFQFSLENNELKFKNSKPKNGDFYNEIYRSLKSNSEELDLYIRKNKNIRHSNQLTFSIVKPVLFNNQTSGVIGFDFSLKDIAKTIKSNNLKKTGVLLLYNNELSTLNYSIPEDDINKTDLEKFILATDYKTKKTIFLTSDISNKKYSIVNRLIDIKTKIDKLSIIVIEEADSSKSLIKTLSYRFFILIIIIFLTLFIIISFVFKELRNRLNETSSVINAMATGEIPDIKELNVTENDDISKINNSINVINKNLDKTAEFISAIAKGNFEYKYDSVSENDKIGNSLVELKKNLEQAKELELKRKEEDERQNWATIGTAKFSEIIREHSDNLEDLSYAIVSDLVNYIGANQGGLFVVNVNNNNEKYIELLASYAFSRRKMLTKKIPWGVGLVGRCILEKETVFMTKIPEKYLSISSGLGEENPASLLIVPLIFHEEVFGVVELASFTEIKQYKIDLVEHISESIASAISMVKINVRTAELLRESKIKTEQTASQEEEIRQNIEEMQAATDELNAKLEDANSIFKALNSVANIAQFDMNGRIIDASDNFLKLLQKEKKDIIGKVQGSFSSEPKNPVSFKNFWDELRKGKKMEFEQVIKVNDKIIRLNSIYIPIKNMNGDVYKVVSFANIK